LIGPKVLLSTGLDRSNEALASEFVLKPNEGLLIGTEPAEAGA